MILHHVTFRANVAPILKNGLLTAKSQGKLRAVWLCSAAKVLWGIAHVCQRHQRRLESAVVLEVSVPRSWLRRSKKGLWYCPQDIPPERIRGVVTFGAVAA
jgi:hypothetical protein